MGSISVEAKKPHVVFVPFPAQGHVSPMIQLAKLLHSRAFHVTFVNTQFNHKRLARSKVLDTFKNLASFNFETIPDGLPDSDQDGTQDVPSLFHGIRRACYGAFVELIGRLNLRAEQGLEPPVSCIVSDGVMSFGIEAAKVLGNVPHVTFWTASACGLMGYLQYGELASRGIIPFKDENFLTDGTLDTPIDWIPGMKNMRLKDIPSFVRTTDLNDIFFDYLKVESESCFNSSAVIFNTFEEFEPEVLEAMRAKFPDVFPTGPLQLLGRHMDDPNGLYKSLRSNLWKEDTKCLEWLENQEPESVLYVNYGSITTMTEQHFLEFAWGLASSKHPFLWIVRPDAVKGNKVVLPEEFFEEVKDRGMLSSWCPQDLVLECPSVGVFLTHCGWNSIMESVTGCVPVICWPFFAEQQTNCRYACTEWGIGMEMNPDVKREEVEVLVKEMMEGRKGKELREKAKEWKRKAMEASDVGGSSYNNFDRVLKEFLLCEK